MKKLISKWCSLKYLQFEICHLDKLSMWGQGLNDSLQCDQIWRFIGLWATFKCFWKHLICPNISHSYGIFVKVSKYIIFLVKSVLGKFYRRLAIFSGLYNFSKVENDKTYSVELAWQLFWAFLPHARVALTSFSHRAV